MLKPDGLTATEFTAWKRAQAAPVVDLRIVIRVLTLDENVVGRFEPTYLNGQREMDARAEVTRVWRGDFLDPGRGVWFEPGQVGEGPLYRSRMLEVSAVIFVHGIDDEAGGMTGRWVSSTEFTGVIWEYNRVGPMVTVVCRGKDQLAAGTAGKVRNFGKKARRTTVARTVLRDAGETRFSISASKARLTKKLTVAPTDVPLQVARAVVRASGRVMFWNGEGRCVIRSRSSRVAFNVSQAMVLGPRTGTSPDLSERPNGWRVIGKKPKGQKTRVRSPIEWLKPWHPLSPQKLKRGGRRFENLVIEENDQMTEGECRARARQLRQAGEILTDEIAIDTRPIYGLEEHDLLRIQTGDGLLKMRADRVTTPYSTEGDPVMTLGAIRKATPSRGGRK